MGWEGMVEWVEMLLLRDALLCHQAHLIIRARVDFAMSVLMKELGMPIPEVRA